MAKSTGPTKTKAANDAYTGMMAISLVALLIGTAVLYLDYSRYPDKPPAKLNFAPTERPPRDQVEPKNQPKTSDDNPDEGGKEKDAPKG